MKAIWQTPHQIYFMAQDAFFLRRFQDTVIKESAIAWREAMQAKKNGEPHIMENIYTSMLLGIRWFCRWHATMERQPRVHFRWSIEGFKGCVYIFISIHKSSEKQELCRMELSSIENKRGDKLMKCLQRDFRPELNLGKSQKKKRTTLNRLFTKTWQLGETVQRRFSLSWGLVITAQHKTTLSTRSIFTMVNQNKRATLMRQE